MTAEPVGVGGDHRHLAAAALTRTPVSTGRMSSREAARATSSTVSASAWAGIVSGSSLGLGKLREVLAGEDPQVEAGAAAADLDVALRLAQLELYVVVAERASELGEQAAGKEDRSVTVGLGVERGLQAHLEVGGARVTLPPSLAEKDAGERLGGGARRDSSADDSSLATSS